MNETTLENAIRCIEDARRQLRDLYLPAGPLPGGEGYDALCAGTPVPEHLRAISDSLHAGLSHLLNLRDGLQVAV